MIRGKYLRERKGIRVKRRFKLILTIFVLMLVHRIVFNSFSLYESNAVSEATIEVATIAKDGVLDLSILDDTYDTQTIKLDEMLPGDKQTCRFSIANYYIDQNTNQEVITETDMEYELKVRTTTNLPLKYKLSKSTDGSSEVPISLSEIQDEHNTYFYTLLEETGEFRYTTGQSNVYTIEIEFPAEYDSIEYQNIIECIEITVEGHQKVSD